MPIKGQAMVAQYIAWNTSTMQGQSGDVANHSIRAIGDGTEFTPAAAPVEVDSSILKGVYTQALAAGEANYNVITIGGKSSTPNVVIIPITLTTVPANAGADPLLNTVPGVYASGTAGAALGRIGSGQIVTVNPVAQNGSVAIVSGMDYFAADGRSLDFTDASAQWPDLTGATITLTIYSSFGGNALFSKAGSVVTPSGAGKKVRAELSSNDTSGLPGGSGYHFIVSAALSDGHKADLVRGSFAVANP